MKKGAMVPVLAGTGKPYLVLCPLGCLRVALLGCTFIAQKMCKGVTAGRFRCTRIHV